MCEETGRVAIICLWLDATRIRPSLFQYQKLLIILIHSQLKANNDKPGPPPPPPTFPLCVNFFDLLFWFHLKIV